MALPSETLPGGPPVATALSPTHSFLGSSVLGLTDFAKKKGKITALEM